MIKVKEEQALYCTDITDKLDKGELALYIALLGYQQENTYFQTIEEIAKYCYCKNMKSYKTIHKYLKALIDKGFVYKHKGIYFINYVPQKRIW